MTVPLTGLWGGGRDLVGDSPLWVLRGPVNAQNTDENTYGRDQGGGRAGSYPHGGQWSTAKKSILKVELTKWRPTFKEWKKQKQNGGKQKNEFLSSPNHILVLRNLHILLSVKYFFHLTDEKTESHVSPPNNPDAHIWNSRVILSKSISFTSHSQLQHDLLILLSNLLWLYSLLPTLL